MPLIAGDWWKRGVPILKGEANVETADVAALNITSELLSANALRRSVVIALPAFGGVTTTVGLMTSTYKIWTPSAPIRIAALTLTPMSSWIQTTAQSTQVGTLYAGTGGNVIGTVVIPTTNAPLGGVPLAFSALANVSVPVSTPLVFQLQTASSSGMSGPQHLLTIDYDSTA